MGGCVSKKMSVEYDPQMKEKQKPEQKQEQEKRNSEASSSQTKLESDVYGKQSGSKRALSLLFKLEEDEQSELLQKQGIEEKDTIQKYEAINPSVNAVKSEKQENLRECEVQNVVIQDVEPGVSQPSLQQLAKDLVKLETSTAASNVSSTNEMSHVQTENMNINEPNLFTTTVQVGSVSGVENVTGVETCITNDGNGIHEKIDEASPVTEDDSSFKDEDVNENNENSLKSGTDLPFVEIKNTSAHEEGKNSDANIQNSNEDTSKDSDAYIQSSQVPQVKLTSVNDHHKTDAENRPLSATLPAGENYALDTNTKNTVVGNCASDNAQVESLVAEHKQSSNNVQDACSDVMMPISCSVQNTSTVTENIDELPVKNHHHNLLLVKTEENILENLEATGIQSNMTTLADSSQEKASSWSRNANLKPNGDSQSNFVITKTEEKTTDSKEAPVGEPMVSTVSTYSPMSSVFEASTMPEKELEEKSMEEPHGTFKVVGEGENQMENKEIEAPEEQVREMKASCQVDHFEIKAVSQKSYVDKNANQGSEILGKDISPSKMNQERLSDSNLLVLESIPKENDGACPTKLVKELAENGNAFAGENMESPSVSNTLSAKQDSQSKDVADNYGIQVKSPEAKQE